MEQFIYQWNVENYTYEKPKKESKQTFMDRTGHSNDQEIIESFKSYNLSWFMGTQNEYDDLNTNVSLYYSVNDKVDEVTFTEVKKLYNLEDGKVVINFDKNVKQTYPDAIEKTKAEYDAWFTIWKAKADLEQKELDKDRLAQDNVFLSSAKVAQQVLLKLIAQQINGNQETISMNLSVISTNNENVLRKVLAGTSSITDVIYLNLNVSYRTRNSSLHTDNADLEAYALALSTLKVEEMTGMYDDVINNSMSVGDAFQKEMKKQLPTTKEVQLGKKLHETYVINTIGQDNYNKFLDIFKELDLTTHLEAFTKVVNTASKIPVDHNTDGIPV